MGGGRQGFEFSDDFRDFEVLEVVTGCFLEYLFDLGCLVDTLGDVGGWRVSEGD